MKKLHLIIFLIFLFFNTRAQLDVKLSNGQNKPCNILLTGKTDIQFSNALAFLQTTLKPIKYNHFVLKKTEIDQLGFQHNQYSFYYDDILIEGLGYNVQAKNGIINSAYGNFYDVKDIPTKPFISEQQALVIALRSIKANKYDWEIDPITNPYPKAELVIKPLYEDYRSIPIFKLVYKFEITAAEPFSSDFIYIDATKGDIVAKSSKLRYLNDVQATAQTRYSGNQTIWTNADLTSPTFSLWEHNISRHTIQTINNNHMLSFGGGGWSYYLDADNFWSNAEWNNTNFDNVALDIHWANEKCFDYFKTVFNRNGYNDNIVYPGQTNYVHYGINNPNALYFRNRTSDPGGYLLFGDGDATRNPYGSLDIYAHEYAHGLFDFTVGGTSNSYEKEFGAIQESLSNIWSSIIEAWAAPSKNHWLGGEEIMKNGTAIDDYSNPNNTLQPDTYKGLYWQNTVGCAASAANDYCGVHKNAGVMQYWYYLLCNGGGGINDIGNAFAVSGIGINKVAQIVYRTEVYKTSGINIAEGQVYFSFRQATIDAASDLYGANSCEVNSVINAWFAVGIGSGNNGSSTISGTDNVCNSSTYTLNNIPSGATISWSIQPNNSVLQLSTSFPNAPFVTVTNQHWYQTRVSLVAKISTSTGCYSVIKSIANDNNTSSTANCSYYQESCLAGNVNHPSQSGVTSGSTFVHQGCFVYVNVTGWEYVTLIGSGVPVVWGVGPTTYYSKTLYFQLPLGSGGIPYTFKLSHGTGSCYEPQMTFFTYSNNGFAAGPNPVRDILTVNRLNDGQLKSTEIKNEPIFISNIYDLNTNILLLTQKSFANSKTQKINVSSLKAGYYVLEIIQNDKIQTMKFLKE
jgi:Zn-dependent metalloprotease